MEKLTSGRPTNFLEVHAPPDMKEEASDVRSKGDAITLLHELADRYRRFMLLYGLFAKHMSDAVNVLDNHTEQIRTVLDEEAQQRVTDAVNKARAVNRKIQVGAQNPAVLEDVFGRDPWTNPKGKANGNPNGNPKGKP